jgi:hypothetical protein
VVWEFDLCLQAWSHLRPVIIIDSYFLTDRYASKLFMTYVYDIYQHLLPLTFTIADEETTLNWDCFMNWLQVEIVDLIKNNCYLRQASS